MLENVRGYKPVKRAVAKTGQVLRVGLLEADTWAANPLLGDAKHLIAGVAHHVLGEAMSDEGVVLAAPTPDLEHAIEARRTGEGSLEDDMAMSGHA